MRLVILDTSAEVGEWSAKYVLKRINDFHPGPDRFVYSHYFLLNYFFHSERMLYNILATLCWACQRAVRRSACTAN